MDKSLTLKFASTHFPQKNIGALSEQSFEVTILIILYKRALNIDGILSDIENGFDTDSEISFIDGLHAVE